MYDFEGYKLKSNEQITKEFDKEQIISTANKNLEELTDIMRKKTGKTFIFKIISV
jgi:hypothetical protein